MNSSQPFGYLIVNIIAISALLSACTPSLESVNSGKQGWQLVFRNGPEGETISGSKSELLEAVRNGYPIRMGWGIRRSSDTTKSVEHVADAVFMTIANGTEVFAQTVQIIGQAPDLNSSDIKMRFREQNKWVKMAGTNGYSTGLMVNYLQDTLVNYGQDRKAGTSWYVNYGIIPSSNREAKPLWD